jgi:uncharacterized protein
MTFTWHDLMSTDVSRARALYAELFGWKSDGDLMLAGGAPVAAILPFHDATVGSHWVPSVTAPDLDALCTRVRAAGGTICFGPVPHACGGRFAFATDPQGGFFAARDVATDATGWWRDKLLADDVAVATAFYRALDASIGRADARSNSERCAASIDPLVVARPPVAPRSQWLPHLVVDDLAATTARAARLGMMVVVADKAVEDRRYAVYADVAGGIIGVASPGSAGARSDAQRRGGEAGHA